jgi:hypothetical protein
MEFKLQLKLKSEHKLFEKLRKVPSPVLKMRVNAIPHFDTGRHFLGE